MMAMRRIALSRSGARRALSSLAVDVDVDAFQRDGAVPVRGLLSAPQLEALREGAEWNIANPGPLAVTASLADDPGRFFEDFCNWQDIPQFGRFVHETPLALAAQRLMQSRTVRL